MQRQGSGDTTRTPKKLLGDEGLSSGETKLNSIFITTEVTFTKPKKRDDKLRVNCEKGRGPNTCLLCKPTDTRNGNMLHSDEKNYARNDLNDKVPEDDFPETESPEVKGSGGKFLEQEEQVLHVLAGHEEGTSRKPQKEQPATPRAWRIYLGRETVEGGSGVGMVLVSPDEETNSYAIRLNCYVFEESMDYEALLASLVAYVRKGMKDLHVFVNSKELVDQVEGHKVPKTMEARRYREEVMEATAPFHRF
ncbi:reverse transcriptase domain-containing protein [Tanacetum coccineum]